MLFKNSLLSLAGLAAVAQAGPMIASSPLVERQLVCPAGYAAVMAAGSASASSTAISVIVSTNILVYPVYINQYFAGDTTINLGGFTFNIFGPTTINTIVTATVTQTVTSTVTQGTAVATPFILGIAPIVAGKRDIQKRDSSYVGASGTQAGDCGTAAVFNLASGQCSSSGFLLSTDIGVSQKAFSVSSAVGSISGVFSGSSAGLVWTNAAFTGGSALYCTLAGSVQIIFNGTYPAGCTPVQLTIIPASSCNTASTGTGTSTTSGTPTASGSSAPTVSGSSTTSAPTVGPTSVASTTSFSTFSNSTMTATSSSATSTVTGAFQLTVNIPGFKAKRAANYIGTGGVITQLETNALSFFIVSGSLFSGDGEYSATSGSGYQAFSPNALLGDITGVFAATGGLAWTNSAFLNGVSTFCVLNSAIFFVFDGVGPSGCVAVTVAVVPLAVATSTSAAQDVTTVPTSIPTLSTARYLNTTMTTSTMI